MTFRHNPPLLNANAPRSCEERLLCLATMASRPGAQRELSKFEVSPRIIHRRGATYINKVATRQNTSRHPSGKVSIRSGLSANYPMAWPFDWIPWRARVGARGIRPASQAGLCILWANK